MIIVIRIIFCLPILFSYLYKSTGVHPDPKKPSRSRCMRGASWMGPATRYARGPVCWCVGWFTCLNLQRPSGSCQVSLREGIKVIFESVVALYPTTFHLLKHIFCYCPLLVLNLTGHDFTTGHAFLQLSTSIEAGRTLAHVCLIFQGLTGQKLR